MTDQNRPDTLDDANREDEKGKPLLSERSRAGSECAPWVIEEVKRLEAQNKQPPAEAGDGAVAWMHPISGAVIKASQRIEGVTLVDFSIPLYTSQTAATQAAVAAAMRKFAEVLLAEIKANYGTAAVSDGPLWHSLVSNSIPAEATAALDAYIQEKCMEVAKEMNTIKSIVDDDSIYSIVTSVIEKGK